MSKPSIEPAPKKRHTPAQREKLVRQFQSGGGTQAAYCREHRLHPATLSAWLRTSPEPAGAPVFQEFLVARPAGGLELHLAGGDILRFHDPVLLVPVLRAVREAASC